MTNNLFNIAEIITEEYDKNTPLTDIKKLYETLGKEWEESNPNMTITLIEIYRWIHYLNRELMDSKTEVDLYMIE